MVSKMNLVVVELKAFKMESVICQEGVYFSVNSVASMGKLEFVKQNKDVFFLDRSEVERIKILESVYKRCSSVFRKNEGAL